MSLVIDALVNLWRLFRNAYVRLFGRPPAVARTLRPAQARLHRPTSPTSHYPSQ
jgi:hypothetical protein